MDISILPDNIWEIIFNLIMISFSALGVVYLFSRMLFLTMNPVVKNIIAILSIMLFSFLFLVNNNPYYVEEGFGSLFELNNQDKVCLLINWIFHFFMSVVVYVLVGFRLYGRVDWLLDKKIGKDTLPKEVKEYEKKINSKKGK